MSNIVYSTDGESFDYDFPYELEDGDTYYEGEPIPITADQLINKFDIAVIIDSMEERLFEDVGDVFDGHLTLSEEDELTLLQLMKDFLKDKMQINYYKVKNIKEVTYTEQF